MASDTISPATQTAVNDATSGGKSADSNVQRDAMARLYDDVLVAQKGDSNFVAHDLPLLNQQLHAEGLLPSISLVGVEGDQLIVAPAGNPGGGKAVTRDEFSGEALHTVDSVKAGDQSQMRVVNNADGTVQRYEYGNGVAFLQNEDGTYDRYVDGQSKASGLDVRQLPDGRVEATAADGTREVVNANGNELFYDKDGKLTNIRRANREMALFEYGADGTTKVRMLDANGAQTREGKVLSMNPDGSFEWFPSDWNQGTGSQAALLENANGNFASRNDYGQIDGITRADGSIVSGVTYLDDGTIANLSITKGDQEVARLQINENGVSSISIDDRGGVSAVTADGTVQYKLDGATVHTDNNGHVTSVDYGAAGTRKFNYDESGNLVSVDELDGKNYGVNGDGQPKATVYADGNFFIDRGNGQTEFRMTNGTTSFTNAVKDADIAAAAPTDGSATDTPETAPAAPESASDIPMPPDNTSDDPSSGIRPDSADSAPPMPPDNTSDDPISGLHGADPATPEFQDTPLGTSGRQARLFPDGKIEYDIAEGDSLSIIATDVLAARGVDYSDEQLLAVEQEILAANPQIVDPNLIYIGDTLIVPPVSSSAS